MYRTPKGVFIFLVNKKTTGTEYLKYAMDMNIIYNPGPQSGSMCMFTGPNDTKQHMSLPLVSSIVKS